MHDRPEQITTARLHNTAVNAHTHPQRLDEQTGRAWPLSESLLEVQSRAYRISDRAERCDHSVTGAMDDISVARSDHVPDQTIMVLEEHPHGVGIPIPPLRRALDIGEEHGPIDEQWARSHAGRRPGLTRCTLVAQLGSAGWATQRP